MKNNNGRCCYCGIQLNENNTGYRVVHGLCGEQYFCCQSCYTLLTYNKTDITNNQVGCIRCGSLLGERPWKYSISMGTNNDNYFLCHTCYDNFLQRDVKTKNWFDDFAISLSKQINNTEFTNKELTYKENGDMTFSIILPGIEKDKVLLTVKTDIDGFTLILTAKYSETKIVTREFKLTNKNNCDTIKSELKNGILTIKIPLKEEYKKKEFNIEID
jgi:HSP20 family molecular chaperone IbpA